jgi:hypothetical protein
MTKGRSRSKVPGPTKWKGQAVATVRERGQGDGRWRLEVRHPDTLHEELAGTVGAPNITLRALRVMKWYERRD